MLFACEKCLLILLLAVTMQTCDYAGQEEIERITSLDSMIDAVVIRTNAGATTSYGYMVYVVPAGGETKKGREVFRAHKIDGFQVKWRNSRFLEVHYRKGRILHFTNFEALHDIQGHYDEVEIRLFPSDERTSIN